MEALRKAQKDGVLVGLKDVSGLQPRLDIDVLLLRKPDAFNLFILALSELQKFENTADKMGYYQLAGIHGLPKRLWDGVRSENKENPNHGYGYCPHGRITFPTWHRSYLAIYEQSIYAKMAEIAAQYPEPARQRYLSALKEFRLPYWDYFRPRRKEVINPQDFRQGAGINFNVPLIFTTEDIVVRLPSDDKQLVRHTNPLFRYVCPSEQQGGFDKADIGHAKSRNVHAMRCTVRNPTSIEDHEGDSVGMNASMNGAMVRQRNTIAIRDLIVGDAEYESFATKNKTDGASGNLESLHDKYHELLGGGDDKAGYIGWMGNVPTAGFDPVFWIHHCQIDRYAAIWQAAHPQKWVKSPGAVKELQKENKPFRKQRAASGGTDVFWVGNETRDSTLYGSYYQDAYDPKNPPSPDAVKRRFVDLYNWSIRPGRAGAEFGRIPADMEPLDLSKAQVFNYEGLGAGDVPLDAGLPLGNGVQEFLGGAAAAAEDGAASAEEEKSEPIEAPIIAAPSEQVLQISTAAAAPGTTATYAFTNIPSGATDVADPNVDESKYYRDWYIDNQVQRLAYDGPFSIYYFIGQFSGDEGGSYLREPTLAGSTYVFTSSRDLCDNCGVMGDEKQLVTDTSPITPILLDYIAIGKLQDLSPENVVPFLIANLKWRIVAHGQREDPRETPGFKVGISSKLTPEDGDGISGFLYQEFPQVIDAIIENAD